MKKLCAAMMLIGLTGVTGCASMSDSNDETVKANSAFRTSKEFATGSRLAKPTTPHMVKSVGNDEYNQYNEHKGLANTLGTKSN